MSFIPNRPHPGTEDRDHFLTVAARTGADASIMSGASSQHTPAGTMAEMSWSSPQGKGIKHISC